ncbi:hypothetical protein [Polyangium sp. 6x1]|uniref:hypothetical protein n=1 Tax=Polyangium sp. 6x1 TaxID=3042689 RepID=UPI002482D2CB|nr:hypothetical protein [Polyangium sp. 6x1]MDI1446208.1 hypothetical protein [Polyangium sp. 6x1]
MLLVTKNQRRDAGFSAFVDRIVRHMNLHYRRDVMLIPPDVLRRRVAHCIVKGRERGFTFERSLAVFTAHMMLINPRFHEQSAITRLLADGSLPEQERLEGLVGEISPRAWDEAEAMCDAAEYWRIVDREMADPGSEE